MNVGGDASPRLLQHPDSPQPTNTHFSRPDLLMNSPTHGDRVQEMQEKGDAHITSPDGKENQPKEMAEHIKKQCLIPQTESSAHSTEAPAVVGSKIPQKMVSRIPAAISGTATKTRASSQSQESTSMNSPPPEEPDSVEMRSKPLFTAGTGIPKLNLGTNGAHQQHHHQHHKSLPADSQQHQQPTTGRSDSSIPSPMALNQKSASKFPATTTNTRSSRSSGISSLTANIKPPTDTEDSNTRINRMSLDFHQRRRVAQSMGRYDRERSTEPNRTSVPTMSITSDETSQNRTSMTNENENDDEEDDEGYMITAKINSLANVKYQPGGGQVKIFDEKVHFVVEQGKCDSFGNIKHKPGGGNVQIVDEKVDFTDKAAPKVNSLANVKHKPLGGDVQIENRSLDFREKAAPKVKSLEKVKHKPKGGDKKIYHEKLPWLKYNKPNLPPEEVAKINKHISGSNTRRSQQATSRESVNSSSRSNNST